MYLVPGTWYLVLVLLFSGTVVEDYITSKITENMDTYSIVHGHAYQLSVISVLRDETKIDTRVNASALPAVLA